MPLTKNGFKAAHTDANVISSWWASFPDANIGLRTGRASGVIVVDVDVKNSIDGRESLKDLHLSEPTRTVATPSGGMHLYYRHPGDKEIPCATGVLPGIDIRADGGYVLAAGSDIDGKPYEVTLADEMVDLPSEIAALLKERTQTPARSQTAVTRVIAEGNRNSTLASAAGVLRYEGRSEVQIEAALQIINLEECKPPLPPDEVTRIAKSISRYAPGRTEDASSSRAFGELSEDSVALGFVEAHPNLRYVESRGKWLVWENGVWRKDTTLYLFDLIRQHTRAMAANVKRELQMGRATFISAVERLCRSDRRYAMTWDQFDADDWLLNTPGGIVYLRTGELSKPDPKAYCTGQTAVTPDGDCPRWLAFLAEVTNNNCELTAYLQRVCGYALTGSTREHSLHFFYGTGGNGKSVFMETLTGIWSDYAHTAAMEVFTEIRGDRHPTEIASLDGPRLVVSQETESGKRWAQSRIKALTGSDTVSARFMRQDLFTFKPKLKLLIAGNTKPKLQTVDEAIRRRFHIVPFTVQIPPSERDLDLAATLRSEWPGILAWAIEGCLAYQKQGLSPPAAVIDATKNYLESEDVFADWLATDCEIVQKNWVNATTAFNSWKAFAAEANERPGRRSEFNERLEALGMRRDRDNVRKRHFVGFKVVNPIES